MCCCWAREVVPTAPLLWSWPPFDRNPACSRLPCLRAEQTRHRILTLGRTRCIGSTPCEKFSPWPAWRNHFCWTDMHIYGTWCRTTGRSLVCSTFYLLARNKYNSRLGTADIPGTSNTPHAKSSLAQLSGCTDRRSHSRSRDKVIFWALLLLNKHKGLVLSWATIKTKLKSKTIDENMFRGEIKGNPNRCRYWRINLSGFEVFRIQTGFYDVAIVIELQPVLAGDSQRLDVVIEFSVRAVVVFKHSLTFFKNR